MEVQINIDDIVKGVKADLFSSNPWDDVVPVIDTPNELIVYLTGPIGYPADYNKACYTIANSTKPVKLVLNTPGGSIHTATMIIDAMKSCDQPIIGHVVGSVASAGTAITMHCDDIIIADFAEFMVHNYSHGTSGTGSQVKTYVDFTDRELRKLTNEVYAGFISDEELNLICDQDKEIWLNKSEVLERWERKKAA